jgi:hypothetical protein
MKTFGKTRTNSWSTEDEIFVIKIKAQHKFLNKNSFFTWEVARREKGHHVKNYFNVPSRPRKEPGWLNEFSENPDRLRISHSTLSYFPM